MRHGRAQGCRNCTAGQLDRDYDPLTACEDCPAGQSSAVGATECAEEEEGSLDEAEDFVTRWSGILEAVGVILTVVGTIVCWLWRGCKEEESERLQAYIEIEEYKKSQEEGPDLERQLSVARSLRLDDLCFTGRAYELEQLRAQLGAAAGGGRAALTAAAAGGFGRQSIVQYGGAGKTTLMRKFAHDRRVTYPDGVFWVDADGADRLRSSFSRLARKLGSEPGDEDEHESVATAAEAALRQQGEQKWLLCVDNADDDEVLNLLRTLYLPQRLKGAILITSRSSDSNTWQALGIPEPLHLAPLGLEESCVLLMRRARRGAMEGKEEGEVVAAIDALERAERDALHEVAEERLGGLPLALEQAGAYLNRQPHVTFSEYSEILSDSSTRMFVGRSSRIPTNDGDDALRRSVASTWTLNLELVTAEAPQARQLLDTLVFGCARGTPVPERLIHEMVRVLSGKGDDCEHEVNEWLLGELVQRSSIVQVLAEEGEETRSYTIHRLLHDVVVEQGRESEAQPARLIALRAAKALVLSYDDILAAQAAEREPLLVLLPHLSALCSAVMESPEEAAADATAAELLAVAQFAVFVARYVASDFGLAVRLLERLRQVELEPDDAAWAVSALGKVLREQGDLDAALETLQEALAMKRELHGDRPHQEIATSIYNIGLVLQNQGDLEGALAKLEEALGLYRAAHGDVLHQGTADTLICIANALQDQGDLEGALAKYEESLAINRALHGDTPHSGIAASLGNIGRVLRKQGNLDGALAKLEEALAMQRARHGDTPHRSIAASLNNIGQVAQDQGDLEGALAKMEESLAMDRALHGDRSHPRIAVSLANIGNVLREQGDLDGALAKYEEALAMDRAVSGDANHPHTAFLTTKVEETTAQIAALSSTRPVNFERGIADEV